MPNEFVKHELPVALQEIDISGLASVEPQELVLNPTQVVTDTLSAGRAIVYARPEHQASYDTIGFRTFAASPRKGHFPLQTSTWSAMQRNLTDSRKSNTVVEEILDHQPKLRHSPLALPKGKKKEKGIENYRYVADRNAIHLYRRKNDSTGQKTEDRWTFSLTDLPNLPKELLLTLGVLDKDEPMITSQQLQVDLQSTHWLPFPVLLTKGCFSKFQDIRSLLIRKTQPGSFYCFLSHRWLSAKHPDPDASQAQFAAWQLIAHLTEAVRIAHQRGLHEPRQFSSNLGIAVGLHGTKLAESLIVNVLRFLLDSNTLQEATAEILSLETVLEDYGIAKALKDAGLKELNSLLADRPILSSLSEHIYIWYDYSCLPQPPLEGDEIDLFKKGLEEFTAAQILGRTSIMLDDADDYLSRAWCTLEALVAGTLGRGTDLFVGSLRPSTAKGDVEHYFENLLKDRPHVVWRAILDTEVFEIQSSATCMERLGLDLTDPNDLPFIYKRLRDLPAPVQIHTDDSEVVTGVLPLPSFENGTVAVCARKLGISVFPDAKPMPKINLNWTDALFLEKAWHQKQSSAAATPPFFDLPKTAYTSSCHIAVVGASEGEAILLANWVHCNKAELEPLFSVSVTSISWVATDIAPVGHFAVGTLEAFPVKADKWVIVASSARLQVCPLTGFITESLKLAGVSHITVAIDQHENNVEILEQVELPSEVDVKELTVTINLAENPPKIHPGGLFKWQIQEELL